MHNLLHVYFTHRRFHNVYLATLTQTRVCVMQIIIVCNYWWMRSN